MGIFKRRGMGCNLYCFKGDFKMDVLTTSKFKKILVAERERLLNNSALTIKHELNVSTDDLPDEADLAASEITQSLTFELRKRERVMIAKINTALQRIQSGNFGECEHCEEAIEKRRLEARPFSTLCVACQEQTEHREKVYA
jgi:DnaK suppressor protein